MRALVTGASGFVGQHLIRHLVDNGDQVIGADRSAETPAETLCDIVQLDVSDSERVSHLISDFRPEVIYHLAGIAFVPEAENNFDRALLVNVGGTNNLIRVCHLLQLGTTFVYVSSAEVYGRIGSEDLPVNEKREPKPANNYSLSKLMGELVTERYAQFSYVRPIVMRPFNHVGPGQDNRFVVSSFAFQLAQIAKGLSEPTIRVGNLSAQRDFSDVRDIVRAYRLAAEQGSGAYNLCSGKAVSIQTILDTLIDISGLRVAVERDADRMRPSEVPVIYGDYSKAKAELNWEPENSLRDTLTAVYNDWLQRIG